MAYTRIEIEAAAARFEEEWRDGGLRQPIGPISDMLRQLLDENERLDAKVVDPQGTVNDLERQLEDALLDDRRGVSVVDWNEAERLNAKMRAARAAREADNA